MRCMTSDSDNFGGMDRNMWTWSRANTPRTMWTPTALQVSDEDLPDTFAHGPFQDPVSVFCDPNDGEPGVNRVRADDQQHSLKRTGWKPVAYLQ